MTIDDKLLAKLEDLSAIKIDSEKKETIKNELNDILSFVENLNKIDIKEDIDIQKYNTPLREDEIIISDVSNHILDNAPKASDRFFIVPKIVE